jgi:hypothetical protein
LLAAIVLLGTAAGGTLGALTNCVNGRISPDYFMNALGWEYAADVPAAAVAQGIYEGTMLGLVLSTLFAVTVGWVSKARCPFRIAAYHLLRIFAWALVCWCLGGMIGVLLAIISPGFFPIGETFRQDYSRLLSFAWVGGSIQAIEWGGSAMALLECILFRARWSPPSHSHSEDGLL